MGGPPCVLQELRVTQADDVVDALRRRGRHISGVARVAIHRQTLLQGQLEPIPARDAVASPVVEVLVGDHGINLYNYKYTQVPKEGEKEEEEEVEID
eukprot:COSAG06_NODE_38366_length_424_cov_1.433846_1_plen_96_part_10